MQSANGTDLTMVIVGAGPGIGAAVAERFGREGLPVGLIARNQSRLDDLVADLTSRGVVARSATADIRRAEQLVEATTSLESELGPPDVVCFSPLPDIDLIKPVLATSADELLASLELTVGGAATAVAALVPGMRERGRGTILFTTGSASLNPSADRAASGVATTAAAAYYAMLHDALAPEGIHVAHTAIVGAVGEHEKHQPAAVAEHLWQRHVARDQASSILR